MDFELALNPRDMAGAETLALAASTPGNPAYRHYLTPRQWESRFSPTVGQVEQVKTWLQGKGLRVTSVSSDRLAVDVSGTSAGVDSALDTTLAYRDVQGERVRAVDSDLTVPSTLTGIVAGSVGLNETMNTLDASAPKAARHAAQKSARRAAGRRVIAPPLEQVTASPCGAYYGQDFDTTDPAYGQGYGNPLPYVPCGYTPAEIREAYDVAGLVDSGDTGKGQTVAVIDAYASPTLLSDAQHYALVNDPSHPLASSQFTEMLAHSFNLTRGTSATGCSTSEAYAEQALDVEAVHAMAPGAHILYVGAKNCHVPLYQALRKVVDHHLANIVTASWGDDAGDVLDDAGLRASVNATLTMAAGTGVSVIFSSADDGDGFSDTGTVAPDFPASSPWATAVGGTTLEAGFGVGQLGWSSALSYLCTQATQGIAGCSPALVGTWMTPSYSGGSGGGTSYHYTQPSYQAGVVPVALATRNAAVTGSTPMRVEPDVAMDGDVNTGLLIGLTETFPGGAMRYGQLRGGGTSLASPLFAGIVALADQLAGRSLGFVNPALYQLHRSQPGVIDDVGPGTQAQRLVRYGDGVDTADGLQVLTSIVGYQGPESYCPPGGGACRTQNVSLSTTPGYDDVTGLGTPTLGFVPALAKL